MAQQPPTTNHRPPPLPAIITLLRFELARFRSLPAPSSPFPLIPARDLIYLRVCTCTTAVFHLESSFATLIGLLFTRRAATRAPTGLPSPRILHKSPRPAATARFNMRARCDVTQPHLTTVGTQRRIKKFPCRFRL